MDADIDEVNQISTESQFTVTVGSVSGPLEVILDLVEKRKLYVSDVSLSSITDEYVLYVQSLPDFHMENVSHFLTIASTLLLIKSRSLLPSFQLTLEEQKDVSDLKHSLERLKIYKQGSRYITQWWNMHMLYEPRSTPVRPIVFSPGSTLTQEKVAQTMRLVLATLPKMPETRPVAKVRRTITIEEVILKLTHRISKSEHISFRSSTKSLPKSDVIVYFLALLELVKRGAVSAVPVHDTRDIVLRHDTVGVPNFT